MSSSTEGLPLLQLLETLLRAADQGGEGGGIADGEVGQHLAVERVPGSLEAGDELRIRDAVQAGGGVDAGDPQLAEVTLAILAAGVGEVEALLDGLLGDAVTARLHPVVATGQLQDLCAAVLPLRTSFGAGHDVSSFRSFRSAGPGVRVPRR